MCYTGVDPKQEFGNKKEEQQASEAAIESMTGDPGTDALGRITGRDHWALLGIIHNFEGGEAMGSLCGITGDHWGSLGMTGDHW